MQNHAPPFEPWHIQTSAAFIPTGVHCCVSCLTTPFKRVVLVSHRETRVDCYLRVDRVERPV
jgi:hypothetical protein